MAAKETTITAVSGAPALGQKMQVMQRTINVATDMGGAWTHTNWIELFTLEAGDSVMGCVAEVVTASTDGSSPTLDIGWGAGAEIMSAFAADADAVLHGTMTASNLGAATSVADTVDMSLNTASLTNGVFRITIVVLKAGDFEG